MNPEPLNRKVVVQLFAKFQARYGHRWTSAFGGSEDITRIAVAEWADGLAGITPEQLRDGLNAWDGDWPPCLTEFRRACLGVTEPKCNEDWEALGSRLGIHASPGESWPAYIGRVKRGLRDPRRLNPEVQRLAHGAGQELLSDG